MTPFQNLDWDDLRFFLQVARTRSISVAARRLRVDSSTVSRRIASLEVAVGQRLFERAAAGVTLTEMGAQLVLHVERIEAELAGAKAKLLRGSASGGTVRVATMEGIASLYLAARLKSLLEIDPSLVIELVTSANLVRVNRREADIFLSFFESHGQGLESERLTRFRLGVFAAPSYLREHGEPRSADELAEHRFVTYIDDLIQVDAVRWLDDVIRRPRVVFHSSSMIAQMNAAAAGMGLVVLPLFAVQGRADLVQILPDTAHTTRDLWACVHKDLRYSPGVKTVLEFLRSTLRSDPALFEPLD